MVCFGTAGIGRVTQDTADEAVELVLAHGVNHIDIAPTYGEAMERMKSWMPRIRDRMFLGAKTGKRSKDEAWDEINDCMRRLGVDSFDLFQLHSVANMEELDKATGKGGALEALVEMRDRGLTKFIGITGHGPEAPRVQIEALDRFDFDTVMFPVSAAIYGNAAYRRDAERLLALANQKERGRPHDKDDRPRRMGRPRTRVHDVVRPAPRSARHRRRAVVGAVTAHAHRALGR